jgi:hypothetical protein
MRARNAETLSADDNDVLLLMISVEKVVADNVVDSCFKQTDSERDKVAETSVVKEDTVAARDQAKKSTEVAAARNDGFRRKESEHRR